MASTRIAAVRGAVGIEANTPTAITGGTARLLEALVEANGFRPADVVSAFFTATPDLNADFPAHAARHLGWNGVPLLCATEIPVPGAPPRIVRVLVTLRTRRRALRPLYLGGAARLRPDLAGAANEASPRARAMPLEPHTGRRIALIGLGQIGGSAGLALGRAGGWTRAGHDRSAAVRRTALLRGAIDEAAPSLEAACADADIAFIATPVDTIPSLVARAARALPAGAVLIDAGSARGRITAALRRASTRVRPVGGHPLAGTEGRGIAAARADLFDGARFALCPTGRVIPRLATRFVRALRARPLRVTPGAHDRALAATSHLPYLVSCALRASGEAAARRGLAGPGFAGMTRLAASDPRMARAYCRENARNVRTAWRALRSRIDREVEQMR